MDRIVDHRLGMVFVGNLEVLQAIKEQAKNPKSNIRAKVVIPGGIQRGVYPTGAAEAIAQLDATDGIEEIYCNSAGAAVAYSLVGRIEGARRIFHKHNPSYLIKLPRYNPFIDLRGLNNIFEQFPIDEEAFRNSKTRVVVNLTDLETQEEILIDAGKTKTHPLTTVMRTMSWPYITNIPLVIDEEGRLLADGCLKNPAPVNRALEADASHVLTLSTSPLTERMVYSRRLSEYTARLVEAGILPAWAGTLAEYPQTFNQSQDRICAYLEGKEKLPDDVKFAVIAPLKAISPISMNGSELRRAQSKARIFTSYLFQLAQTQASRT